MSEPNRNYEMSASHRSSMEIGKIRFMVVIAACFLLQSALVEAKAKWKEADLIGDVRSVVYKEGPWKSGNWVRGGTIVVGSVSYDTDGHKVKSEKSFYRDQQLVPSSKYRAIYRYDAKNHREEVISYSEEGSPLNKEVFVFDKQGRIMEHSFSNAGGSLKSGWAYRYIDKDGITEMISYRVDDFVSMRMVHYLNKGGSVTGPAPYEDYDAIDSRMVNSYDEDGQRIETLTYKNEGSLDQRWKFNYNTKGHKVRVSVYDSHGTIRFSESYSYEFDLMGNWIKQVISTWEFGKGSHDKLKLRAIEYY